jgi:AhpD family alkylhydroperoxidase
MKSWPEITRELTAQLRNLRGGSPEVMKAFSSLAQAACAAKALDRKTKELIALGIAVAVRCDDCIGFHVKAALEQGASEEEVTEVLGMAIYMGAGPAVMYASHALNHSGNLQAQRRSHRPPLPPRRASPRFRKRPRTSAAPLRRPGVSPSRAG